MYWIFTGSWFIAKERGSLDVCYSEKDTNWSLEIDSTNRSTYNEWHLHTNTSTEKKQQQQQQILSQYIEILEYLDIGWQRVYWVGEPLESIFMCCQMLHLATIFTKSDRTKQSIRSLSVKGEGEKGRKTQSGRRKRQKEWQPSY